MEYVFYCPKLNKLAILITKYQCEEGDTWFRSNGAVYEYVGVL